jgi:hypothetical protein
MKDEKESPLVEQLNRVPFLTSAFILHPSSFAFLAEACRNRTYLSLFSQSH